MLKLPKFARDLRFRLFYSAMVKRGYRLETFGDQSYGLQWTICPDGLNAQSIVYGGGVGEDISFEHALVERFGCNVVIFDPSPTGLKTMALPENKNPRFHFFPVALSARPGKLKMAPPGADGVSWSAQEGAEGAVEVESVDLLTLMKRNGHDHVDLLKLDIEGCEYEVIDDILAKNIPVRQICADFDYGYVATAHRSQAIAAMFKLRSHGYRLIHHESANHTFLRMS